MKRFTASQKLEIVAEVVKKRSSVYSVCKTHNISKTSFYSWLSKSKRTKKNRLLALENKVRRGKNHYRSLGFAKKLQILRLVHKHPEYSSHKIAKILNFGNHGVQNLLQRQGLNKYSNRLEFSRQTFWKRQSSQHRLEIINLWMAGSKVKDICHNFGISKVTFNKWKKRFLSADPEARVQVLVDQYVSGARHYRFLTQDKVNQVLELVKTNPQWSVHRLYQGLAGFVGHHGVQNILKRHNLSTFEQRLAFSQAQEELAIPRISLAEIPYIPVKLWRLLYAPFATIPKLVWLATRSFASLIAVSFIILLFFFWVKFILLVPGVSKVGTILATTSLTFGFLFFLYSLKYYLSAILVLTIPQVKEKEETKGREAGFWSISKILKIPVTPFEKFLSIITPKQQPPGLVADLSEVKLEKYPFVSIHIPLYNEKKVAERILTATLAQEYPKDRFEIIVADDSTDETTEIVRRFETENSPKVKVTHRDSREGFKGGALREALRVCDPAAEYVLVFDADFIPFPDTISQFVKYFQLTSKNSDPVSENQIAVVQGYQWHVLNKSENWITRGVRAEYAGSYVVERSATEIYSGIKMIAGSVYCIKRNILDKFGWGTSITEDFQLTLRLYAAGYKVIYTPYIQTPSECVSTVRRLVRQRMRWAEGHTFNIKKLASSMLASSQLTLKEKLEFFYLAPYYLQAAFFMIGTLSWFASEAVFHTSLPFWTAAFGWSLVFTNFLSLPLMNSLGLFLEEAEKKDYFGILSFVALAYIVTPFQAYAAIKGLLEREEGPWFRTPKTGIITDVISKIRLGFWWRRFLPFGQPLVATPISTDLSRLAPISLLSARRGLAPKISAHQRFLSKSILAILLVITLLASSLSLSIPATYATNRGADYGQYTDVYCVTATDCKISYYDVTNADLRMSDCDAADCSSGGDRAVDETGTVGQYTSISCVATGDCKISYYLANTCTDTPACNLKFADCESTTCDSRNLATPDSTGDVGQWTSIDVASTETGATKVSYYGVTSGDLKFRNCTNATCTTGNTNAVDTTGDVGQYTSLDVVAGADVKVSYYDVTNGDLKFRDCDNGPCTTGTNTTVDTGGLSQACDLGSCVGQYTGVSCPPDVSTDCKISYYDVSNGDLKFADCDGTDVDCTTVQIDTVDSTGDVGQWTSVFCTSGTDCSIVYYDVTNTALKFLRCLDGADADSYPCNAAAERTINTLDGASGCVLTSCSTTAAVGQYTGIYCPANDDCKISYYDSTNGDLKFADCGAADCGSGSVTTVALTVPEFIGFLIPIAPFLPKIVKKLKEKNLKFKNKTNGKGNF